MFAISRPSSRLATRLCAVGSFALLLTACGGGQDTNSLTNSQAIARSAPGSPTTEVASAPAASRDAITFSLQEGARLNAAELEAIAQTGVLPETFDGPLLSGADTPAATDASATKSRVAVRKSAASRVPVYRFFNTQTSAHFFTTSETERANLIATQPFMTYEGPAFHASSTPVPGLSPVHRFFNRATGVHFYTISDAERAHIASTMPIFVYEGIGYYASTLPGTGYTPLYRFFYTAKGFHFYTNSESEKNTIIATLPQYRYEGIGYQVLSSDWQTPAIPHTGVTSSQCFQAGSNSLVACSSAGALALNPQQDGHRTDMHPMSYSLYANRSGGIPVAYGLLECVKDDVTGLIWEGKTPSGSTSGRSGSSTYTNYGDGRTGDASAYVNAVNAIRLCGFTDWRMPTVDELLNLMGYADRLAYPFNSLWFPNGSGSLWSSNAFIVDSANRAWLASNGTASIGMRSESLGVRLVRGSAWSGPRYAIVNTSYMGDSANNAVLDRKTGLTWRRCEEGRTWNGSTCTGSAVATYHVYALDLAKSKPGWRLPNVKELVSLIDFAQYAPAIDRGAFPGAAPLSLWASTPSTPDGGGALVVSTTNGQSHIMSRTSTQSVRLVKGD